MSVLDRDDAFPFILEWVYGVAAALLLLAAAIFWQPALLGGVLFFGFLTGLCDLLRRIS